MDSPGELLHVNWERHSVCPYGALLHGRREQKARNLEHNAQVALTTGTNTWAQGLDVVVEGTVVRVTDRDALQRLADAYEAKYGSVWYRFSRSGDWGRRG